jgi:alkylation response protein AidB-like acyl-CoA dehydrogenase
VDFHLDQEQLALRQSIIDFARSELSEDAAEGDRNESFNRESWERSARFGLTGLTIPREFGGRGLDPLTMMIAMEAFGYGCSDNGFAFAVANHLFACAIPLVKFGSLDQQNRYLPGMARGALVGAHAMTEVQSGSDAAALKTTALSRGDVYILNGRKSFVTNGPVADVFIVFARTGARRGGKDFSAFIVEKTFPGFRVGRKHATMGLKTAPIAEICFDDCIVPAANLLGKEGNGMMVFNTAVEWERCYLSALNLGATKRQFEHCLEYARRRHQFGQPIGSFQAVAHRLASVKVEIEMAELMVYKIGWLRKVKKPAFFESAVVKLFTSESYVNASLAALQVHGAFGYTTSSGVERQVRDSLASTIYAGTSEIQRDIIVGWLGLESKNGSNRVAAQEKQHEAALETI